VGTQYYPQTIGLANGNILVVWTDTYGPSPVSTSPPHLRSVGRTGRERVPAQTLLRPVCNEERPEIADHADGGFVMAFAFTRSAGLIATASRSKRFDSAGHSVASNFIAAPIPSSAQGNQYDLRHKISVNAAGDYVVAFDHYVESFDNDVYAIVFDHATNNPGRCTTTSRTTEVM